MKGIILGVLVHYSSFSVAIVHQTSINDPFYLMDTDSYSFYSPLAFYKYQIQFKTIESRRLMQYSNETFENTTQFDYYWTRILIRQKIITFFDNQRQPYKITYMCGSLFVDNRNGRHFLNAEKSFRNIEQRK